MWLIILQLLETNYVISLAEFTKPRPRTRLTLPKLLQNQDQQSLGIVLALRIPTQIFYWIEKIPVSFILSLFYNIWCLGVQQQLNQLWSVFVAICFIWYLVSPYSSLLRLKIMSKVQLYSYLDPVLILSIRFRKFSSTIRRFHMFLWRFP